MQEVISLHIGQSGCQIGSEYWNIICKEHHINDEGIMKNRNRMDGSYRAVIQFRCCFENI